MCHWAAGAALELVVVGGWGVYVFTAGCARRSRRLRAPRRSRSAAPYESVRPWSRVPRNCVRFARRSARAFIESSESIDPALLRAMLAVFTEREA